MLTRRTFLTGSAALGASSRLAPVAAFADTGRPADVVTRIISIPDFLNSDLASVAGTHSEHVEQYGNSISPDQLANINHVLDRIAAYAPDAVLVAGDLVEGHWGMDSLHTGIFGPVGSAAERTAQMRRAADHYYRAWASRFARRRLRVLPAVGDHEMGDNPWAGWKLATQAEHKAAFARHFTEHHDGSPRYPDRPVGTEQEMTSYGKRVGDVYVLSVDEFTTTPDTVLVTVTGEHAVWMDASLGAARAAGARALIVQGHCPVIVPVRRRHSSGLTVRQGVDSLFWEVMRAHDVELYLCGEVHDTTAYAETGTAQISHGSLMFRGENVNFLIIDVLAGGGMDLRLKQWDRVTLAEKPTVWALDMAKAAPRGIGRLADSPLRTAGTLHLSPRNLASRRSGLLREGVNPR